MSRENKRNGKRRQFTPEERATILRRHLVDKVPVSDLCDAYHIEPDAVLSLAMLGLRAAECGVAGWARAAGETQVAAADRARVTALEAKLAKKDAIIADIAAEHLALKKELGES